MKSYNWMGEGRWCFSALRSKRNHVVVAFALRQHVTRPAFDAHPEKVLHGGSSDSDSSESEFV